MKKTPDAEAIFLMALAAYHRFPPDQLGAGRKAAADEIARHLQADTKNHSMYVRAILRDMAVNAGIIAHLAVIETFEKKSKVKFFGARSVPVNAMAKSAQSSVEIYLNKWFSEIARLLPVTRQDAPTTPEGDTK